MATISDIQRALGDVEVDGSWGPKSQASLDRVIHPTAPAVLTPTEAVDRADERSEKNLATLLPEVANMGRQLVHLAAANGITIVVTSGSRTFAEQDALYRQGGVTKARGGYSNHNFQLAFDVTIFEGGQPVWESKKYRVVGELGKTLGLSWGGDWHSFQDEPHFELRPKWAANLGESEMLAELRRRHAVGQSALV